MYFINNQEEMAACVQIHNGFGFLEETGAKLECLSLCYAYNYMK